MTIVTLYGNIGSGKTTLSSQLMTAFPELVYLGDDALYTMFRMGVYQYGASPEQYVLQAMRMMQIGAVAVNGRPVLIDIPAHTHERRRLFQMSGCDHVAIETGWHEDPAFHAQYRFMKDSRGVEYNTWLNVATRLASERENPSSPWRKIPAGIVLSRLKHTRDFGGLTEILEGP